MTEQAKTTTDPHLAIGCYCCDLMFPMARDADLHENATGHGEGCEAEGHVRHEEAQAS